MSEPVAYQLVSTLQLEIEARDKLIEKLRARVRILEDFTYDAYGLGYRDAHEGRLMDAVKISNKLKLISAS